MSLAQETHRDGPRVGPGCLVCGVAMVIREPERRAAPSDTLLHCAACGLFLETAPSGALIPVGGAEAKPIEYPADGAERMAGVEDTSFWFRHRNGVLDMILDRFPTAGPLWDVGGGNGFQALHFQRRGRPVVMVEPGPTGARNAKTRGVHHVVQGTLESLRLPDERLYGISLLDVLEHLPDPKPILTECRRVLAAGGRIYVTVPACRFLWSDEDVYAHHHRRYTHAMLRNELTGTGFHVEFLTSYFQSLLLPVFLLRTLPYRLAPWRHAADTTDAREHALRGPARRALEYFLARELAALRRGPALGFGTSLLAVARKP